MFAHEIRLDFLVDQSLKMEKKNLNTVINTTPSNHREHLYIHGTLATAYQPSITPYSKIEQ